ncbi:MAG TPA: hypothetical protein VJL31_13020 [Gemmatimonadales bacterium]|nr:hypothetical protein [Gemmatimonadales bacterium]
MRRARLLKARWTEKGLWLIRADGIREFRGRHARLTITEAALALNIYAMLLYRLLREGKLMKTRGDGAVSITVSDARRLRTAWKHTGPTTRMGKRA